MLSGLRSRLFASVTNTTSTMAYPWAQLRFDNRSLRELPLDPVKENYVREKVPNAIFSRVQPTPVDNPVIVACSSSALNLLGLSPPRTSEEVHSFTQFFSGNEVIPGAEPAAHCYCGHQFGYFSGQLGDGATMYLGEVINKDSERWEIQFKGAGKTPYSRQADGRKVLRSTIREFLCSEAMHHLGIPTTRAGVCVTSDTDVIRDIFYSGNPIRERASIVLRIAPTFLRFGSFEIFKSRDRHTGREGPSAGNVALLRQLVDYTITSFYPEIKQAEPDLEKATLLFLAEITKRTAELVAHWQTVGFCHGVLNTDNMSIVGVTIDYGPYGFMERFDPNHICNSSDDEGRYSYKKQPEICKWNCLKLGEALSAIVPLSETNRIVEEVFDPAFERKYTQLMKNKLGITGSTSENDAQLIKSLFDTMAISAVDFTNTFIALEDFNITGIDAEDSLAIKQLADHFAAKSESRAAFVKKHQSRIPMDKLELLMSMGQSNPQYLRSIGIPFDFVQKEYEKAKSGQDALKISPCEKTQRDKDAWVAWLTKYRERLILDAGGLEKVKECAERKIELMKRSNPRLILRNHLVQSVIEEAEDLNFDVLQQVLKTVERPFDSEFLKGTGFPEGLLNPLPDESNALRVT